MQSKKTSEKVKVPPKMSKNTTKVYVTIVIVFIVLIAAALVYKSRQKAEEVQTEILPTSEKEIVEESPQQEITPQEISLTQSVPVQTVTCTDSDIGINILAKGTTTNNTITNSDSCETSSKVREYYCNNNAVVSKKETCPLNHECDNGRCVAIATTIPTEEAECIDSDSNEIEPEQIVGTTTKGSTSNTDYCNGSFSLVEYLCSDNNITSTTYTCEPDNICEDGRCMAGTCSDSDGGSNLFIQGTTTKGSITNTDSCATSRTVREYICEENLITSNDITCTSLEDICDRGICVEGPCNDPDGPGAAWPSRLTRTTVTKGAAKKADVCADDFHVREYYCSDIDGDSIEEITSTELICDLIGGESCELGRCA